MLEIEVDPDLWGEHLEAKTAIRRTRTNYAVSIVDRHDQAWENRAQSVKFEIFKGKRVLLDDGDVGMRTQA